MTSSRAPARHVIKRFLMGVRRNLYGMRAYIPGLREHHRLEAMVGPLGYWKDLQRYQLRLLQSNGLQPHHSLLDIGCGPLQGGVAFIKYLAPSSYTGIDHDPERIQAANTLIARHKLSSRAPSVMVSSTFGKAELGERNFDFIWASQVLCFFNDDVMEELFVNIQRRLAPGGKFLADVYALDHYEFRYPERRGQYNRHAPESLQAVAQKHGLQARFLGTIEQFGYPRRLSLKTNMLFEFTRLAA